ncbi:MAG: histidine phosphotransferase family protein [Alphaproteobacteria bacterium]|nr:histidine phosphotransferase family protein [Alphaproteobacteria bacterium]
MQIDLRVMELLSSKVCHDLVSPVSAINNGVELIEDIGGSVVEEAMKLIGDSAVNAARRLRLFRMAYGRAGSEENLSVRDVRQVAEQYLSGGKITLVWNEDQSLPEGAVQRGFLKTVLNMIILAEETLAYGGVVTVRDAGSGCRLEVVGRSAHLSLQLQEALDGAVAVDELSPRSIQAYVTGKFAEHFGLKVVYDHSIPDRLDLTLAAAPATPEAETETRLVNVS